MTIEQEAHRLIEECRVYASEIEAIQCALWCAKKVLSNIGNSSNDEYWEGVVNYLQSKI